MTPHLRRFAEIIASMDGNANRQGRLTPATYQAAARSIRQVLGTDFAKQPIASFTTQPEALRAVAENLYFERHRVLPDADGTGRNHLAAAVTSRVLRKTARRARCAP